MLLFLVTYSYSDMAFPSRSLLTDCTRIVQLVVLMGSSYAPMKLLAVRIASGYTPSRGKTT